MRGSFRVLSCGVLLAGATSSLFAGTIVSGTPASSHNLFPFAGPVAAYPGTRFQEAYAATDFTGLGLMSISGIDFYEGNGTFRSGTYDFYLSTITAGIDTLSTTDFDSNLGLNNVLFASLTLSGTAPSTLTITGTPFTFDSGAWNLLLDIRISNTTDPGTATFLSRNDASGILSRYHNFGGSFIGYGLVTGFDYDSAAVPGPASGLLVGMGAIALGVVLRRRHSHGLPG
jgi:hypothetical protein